MTYEYEKDTRRAYRDVHKARHYQDYQSRDLTWGRLTSWREWAIVRSALVCCGLSPQAKILDIPCGTGIMGKIFRLFPNPVVAADISLEMMDLAREEYNFTHFLGFVQADITRLPFDPGEFDFIIIMGLMHRLPAKIRRKVLAEIASLRARQVIISYSIDSLGQRLKQRLIKKLKPEHRPAPVPVTYGDIIREVTTAGFKVISVRHAVPLLSADIILVLDNLLELNCRSGAG